MISRGCASRTVQLKTEVYCIFLNLTTMAATQKAFTSLRFCKVGTVPLSIMEYSYCIREAFIDLLPELFPYKKQFKRVERYTIPIGHKSNKLYSNSLSMSLMTLCLRMALFIQSPNYSYTTHIKQALNISITTHYGQTIFQSSQSLIESICKSIEPFLFNEKEKFEWKYHEYDHAQNAQMELYHNNSICMTQDTMSSDAVCVELSPEINLRHKDIYCFQLYCFAKSDEMWVGICNRDNFGDDLTAMDRALSNRITYYGGRYGSNDKTDFWDGKYGAIHGMEQLMQTHLESYGEGDWLTIMIDTFRHKITFFKNKRFQSAINYKKYREQLSDHCVLYVLLDEVFDGVFIEQVLHFGSVWKKVFSGR